MLQKLKSSATVWLGVAVEFTGIIFDYINQLDTALGIGGAKQWMTDLGLNPQTVAVTFAFLGPLIIIARMRTLLRTPK